MSHQFRIRKHPHEEIIILLITLGCHVREILFKQQHKGLAVIILSVALPLLLSSIIIFHLHQNLIHLGKVRTIAVIDLVDQDSERILLLLSPSCFTRDWREPAFRTL